MSIEYYNRDGSPTDIVGSKLYTANPWTKKVAMTYLADCFVSTVFLTLDHGYKRDKPVLFETMVFGGPYDQQGTRYYTEEEALAGHRDVVDRLSKGEVPWLI